MSVANAEKATTAPEAYPDFTAWATARAAATLGGTSVHRIMKAAAQGRIRTLALPGEHTRYNRHDVLAMRDLLAKETAK